MRPCIATAQASRPTRTSSGPSPTPSPRRSSRSPERVPTCCSCSVSDAYAGDAARAGPLAFDEAAPRALAGAVASHGVIGAGRELETGHAVSVLAASFPEASAEVFHSLADLGGVPDIAPDALTVLIADPYTFPTDQLIDHARPRTDAGGRPRGRRRRRPGAACSATAACCGPARSASCSPGALCAPLVSQGCRPIGPELVVTAAAGNALLELAGVPALDKIEEVFGGLSRPTRRWRGTVSCPAS